jgi:hypothetical protein
LRQQIFPSFYRYRRYEYSSHQTMFMRLMIILETCSGSSELREYIACATICRTTQSPCADAGGVLLDSFVTL